MSAVHVAIDVGPCRPRPTGVGIYARDLAAALAAAHPGSVGLIGVREGALDLRALPVGTRTCPFVGRLYQSWLQGHAEHQARRLGARLVHYTNAVAPVLARLPFVATVHDLSLLRHPRTHPAPRLLNVPLIALSVRRAAAIVVPSEATRDELVSLLRLPADRVHVIPEAPRLAATVHAPSVAARLAALGLAPGRYLLSLATIEPRKNIARIVAAFEEVARVDSGLRLAIVGQRGWHWRRILDRVDASPWRERIVVPGYVSDEDRDALMAGCAAFVYVSLYEGFGLPVVEAMAAGAPVVTSDRSSLPEAAGGAAVLVDPTSPAAIAAGIRDALARRDELVRRGRERADELSWARTASQTWRVYEEVLGRLAARRSTGTAPRDGA